MKQKEDILRNQCPVCKCELNEEISNFDNESHEHYLYCSNCEYETVEIKKYKDKKIDKMELK